jgi:hypothetical protein
MAHAVEIMRNGRQQSPCLPACGLAPEFYSRVYARGNGLSVGCDRLYDLYLVILSARWFSVHVLSLVA